MKCENLLQSSVAALAVGVMFMAPVQAQSYPDVKTTKVADGIYMLSARGGNLGVLIGDDGTFLIDDQFSAGSQKIMAEIKKLGGDTPRFLLNTHFHGDHSGGNVNFAQAGATIYSHDNVRKRLMVDNVIKEFNSNMPAMPKIGLPLITYADGITFHINGDIVRAHHAENAHTDGDSFIHFSSANVIHSGDTFFNGFYPYIDPSHGGTLSGVIAAADAMLALANDKTKIIPGHGGLANKANLQAYRDMLATAHKRLKALKDENKSVEQAVAAKPLKDLEGQWGKGIFTSDKWISIVYSAL